MRVAVTGASGYLGRRLSARWIEAGHDVALLLRTSASGRRLGPRLSRATRFHLDQTTPGALFERLGPVDAIVHLATCYGRSNEPPSELVETNVLLPLRIIEAAARAGAGRFVNVDTSLPAGVSPYASSKAQLRGWLEELGPRVTCAILTVRLELFYGPNDDPLRFTARVVDACRHHHPRLELTDGRQRRDFIYVDDVVAGLDVLVSNLPACGGSVLEVGLGSGRAIPVREFVETVHRLTGSRTELAFGALPRRPGEPEVLEADLTILDRLGWRPLVPLEEGVRRVLSETST